MTTTAAEYITCQFCGKTAPIRFFPPHGEGMCPLKIEEHQARLAAIERASKLITLADAPI